VIRGHSSARSVGVAVRAHRNGASVDGQLDIGVRHEVDIPRGMPGVAALGGDQDVAPVLPHGRREHGAAPFAGGAADRVQLDDGHRSESGAEATAGHGEQPTMEAVDQAVAEVVHRSIASMIETLRGCALSGRGVVGLRW